jgi:hypothetical protein
MAPRANLDQDSLCRCRDYVEALIEEGPLGNLWNEAGIVPELVVCQSVCSSQVINTNYFNSHLQTTSPEPIYTK